MKILYDISILGMGHYHNLAKTGIFRVIENIAYGLAKSEECSLSFCSSHSLANLSQVIGYLEASPAFENIPLTHPNLPKNLYKNINRTVKVINGQSKGFFTQKVFRRGLYYSLRLFGKAIKPLNVKELSAADLFHSPFLPFPEYINAARNVKKIITLYDMIPILYPQFFEFDESDLIKKVVHNLELDDWVICISDSTKNDLCNYRPDIDPSKVVVTPLAASELFYPCNDLEEINFIKKKYQIPDLPYILSLSTLEPRKNIVQTIRSFARLIEQENIKDLSLVLVGTKGWNYDDIFAEMSKISALKNRVIVTGFVADEDLAALYSGALASSLPEVVGDAGIMVSPTDEAALCQSMLEIYNSDSLRETMSLKSIEQAKKFSWQKCTGETIAAYKAALKS